MSDYLIYHPDVNAETILDSKKGMAIVQAILDVVAPYNPSTARNALCWAMMIVHKAFQENESSALADTLAQLMSMSVTTADKVMTVEVPKDGKVQ
jgi:hypothetical protein